MGCVFGREATTSEPKQAKGSKASGLVGESSVQVSKSNGAIVEVEKKNEEVAKEENGDRDRKSKGDRRRSKPNPRLSNPSKHWRGEQVAAGWPSWLSDACGEALNGWVPRKADTFEKIDKVIDLDSTFFCVLCFGVFENSHVDAFFVVVDWTRNI